MVSPSAFYCKTLLNRRGLLVILYVFQLTTEMEFDLDKALEDVPVHTEDASSRTPPTPSQVLPKLEPRSTGLIVELPSEEEKKLQHFTKLRPRRNKKTHSSKVPVSKGLLPEENEFIGEETYFSLLAR